MAVAVVRSLGGNHVADRRGDPPRATGPPAMQKNWPELRKIVRTLLSSNGIT